MEGECDPSHKLVDLAHKMFEENTVNYLAWQHQTKRSAELSDTKQESIWKPDSSGHVKVVDETIVLDARTDTDYLLRCALWRRAMAMDIANLCSFELLESWTTILTWCAIPLWDSSMSVWINLREQIASCGFALQSAVAQAFAQNLMGRVLSRLRSRTSYLLPMSGFCSFRSQKAGSALRHLPALALEKALCRWSKRAPTSRKSRKPRTRAKVKNKSQKGPPSTPLSLQGKATRTKAGDPICFAYNLAGCTHAQPGGRCGRGLPH